MHRNKSSLNISLNILDRVDRRRVWTRTVRVAADDETVRCSADDGQELCQFVVETTDGSTRRSVDVGDGERRLSERDADQLVLERLERR